MSACRLQDARRRCQLFSQYRSVVNEFVAHLKADAAFISVKPTPLKQGEMIAIAEEASSGATTPLYGRVAAFLRNLSGVRNPAVSAWQWRHVTFVVVVVARERGDGSVAEEVRTAGAWMRCPCPHRALVAFGLTACFTWGTPRAADYIPCLILTRHHKA